MLIWLPSYPRSGNTLTRLVLNNVFGIQTHTIVGSQGDANFVDKQDVMKIVGAVEEETSGQELIDQAQASDLTYIVKTHDNQLSGDPAIYIVRDGRSSIVSYYHFIQKIAHTDVPLEKIIIGEVYAGKWSDHLDHWSPDTRPNTLLIRYEDLAYEPEVSIRQISDFLQREPKKKFDISFAAMNLKYPEFFRSGSNEKNIAELNASGLSELFWENHGMAMKKFGYA